MSGTPPAIVLLVFASAVVAAGVGVATLRRRSDPLATNGAICSTSARWCATGCSRSSRTAWSSSSARRGGAGTSTRPPAGCSTASRSTDPPGRCSRRASFHETEILDVRTETPLEHGSGLGPWLVRWTVSLSSSVLSFDENEPRGSVVTMAMPAAEP